MKDFGKYLKSASLALGIIIFLDLIGLPENFGRASIWIFTITLTLLAFTFTRQERASGQTLKVLIKAFSIGLAPALGLTLITLFFANLQGKGIRVNEVFAQILPEHTSALTGLTREEILKGEGNAIPGLVKLALSLTAAGLAGGILSLLPYSQLSRKWQGAQSQRISSAIALGLPFFIFAAYLALRLPNVQLFGPKEDILGLILIYLFVASALFSLRALPSGRTKMIFAFVVVALLIWLPNLNDLFQNAVLGFITIFVIMGIGLNIVVGFAGMLDLGYVAFFAVGAYSYALLSAPQSWVLLHISGFGGVPFWIGLLVAITMGMLAGILLGVPVLRLRGDYLAIVTLGFGEIIRLLLVNLRTYTGGPGGVLDVPPPYILGTSLSTPRNIFYLAMAFAALVTFVALRLKESRIGRAWVAMREDERVAQAMGINLVATKLLAFAFGAVFAAISGTIYASRQVNIFPDNFALDVSINVLSLIIIGGIGSLEGIVVGAIVLIGVPEILRGVTEYRIVIFGALLVAMMILRPEGILPSQRRKRELHRAEVENVPAPSKRA